MKLTPITAKVQKQTKGGMIQEPLLNVGRVEGGTENSCDCGSKPCKCGPKPVAKKYSTVKQTAKQKANLPKEIVDAIAAKEGKKSVATKKSCGYK